VPAFDGFEEMFIEGSSGEALSAMGILVGSLESQGAMVVAARKAYFEFENLRTQERLFDTIRTYSVGFGKLELQRWAKSQFIAYCQKRGFSDAEALYQRVSERLLPDHALLTRAVLVKRLVDVATKSPTLDALLEQLQKSKNDFFSVFVRSLIEREASEKWTDRSGEREVGSPLLTVEEHCELLSQIAISMWESKVDHLKRDSLEFVADYFCETNRKSAFQAQQIRERIRGHAMLVPSENATNAVEFDHDEFRLFFLGEGIAKHLRPLNDRAKAEVFAIFRRSVLPKQAQHALIQAIDRDLKPDLLKVIQFLLNVSEMDVQASYTRENCSDIIIRMLSGVPAQGINIKNLVFSPDALRDRKISDVNFSDCYFSATSLELTKIDQCFFDSCSFSQLRIFNNTELTRITFNNCKVDALALVDKDKEIWNPAGIEHQLKQIGVSFIDETPTSEFATQENESDAELSALEKIIRYFMRSTHISESVMRIKLGPQGQSFIDNTLPLLLKHGVMKEIENRGSTQRRFRLNIPLHDLNDAITTSHGSFDHFLDSINHTAR
jgi:hypothetical protein